MEFGKIEYKCAVLNNGSRSVRKLKLTLIGLEDKDLFLKKGVRALRLNRIMRLTREAEQQGCLLSYEDLSALLLTSLATLKRDVSFLDKCGYFVNLKGRRKNGDCRKRPDSDLAGAGAVTNVMHMIRAEQQA